MENITWYITQTYPSVSIAIFKRNNEKNEVNRIYVIHTG